MNLRGTPSILWAGSKWRPIQIAASWLGGGLLLALFVWPDLGIQLLWNLIVPLMPLACVLVPGWWRNSCPLATSTLLGKTIQQWLLPTGSPATTHRVRMSQRAQGIAAFGGVALLVLILPARHLIFDRSGPASALLLLALVLTASILGASFLKKSGWCAGWCPVQPVEKLYGQSPAAATTNARCGTCSHCVVVCPDSVNEFRPLRATPTRWHQLADLVMAGGFVGFVWGWFQVPDHAGAFGWSEIVRAYGVPLAGGAITLTVFLVMRVLTPARWRPRLVRLFATAAVTCYYWFRVPALFGFGVFPEDGVLIDLSTSLPASFPWISRGVSTLFLGIWLLGGLGTNRWMARPPSRIPLRRRLKAAVVSTISSWSSSRRRLPTTGH